MVEYIQHLAIDVNSMLVADRTMAGTPRLSEKERRDAAWEVEGIQAPLCRGKNGLSGDAVSSIGSVYVCIHKGMDEGKVFGERFFVTVA